jgi:hypothetical protein
MAQPRSGIVFNPLRPQATVIDLVAVRAARRTKLLKAEAEFVRMKQGNVLASFWRHIRGH